MKHGFQLLSFVVLVYLVHIFKKKLLQNINHLTFFKKFVNIFMLEETCE